MAKRADIHLGRDTDATMRSVARIGHVLRAAPPVMKGTYPRKSFRLDRFHNTRYRGQLIGSCVGEAGAAMGETTVRTPEPLKEDSVPLDPVAFSQLWCYWIARDYSRRQGINLGGEGAIVSHFYAAANERDKGLKPYEVWPATEANYRSYRDTSVPRAAIEAEPIPPRGEGLVLTDPDQIFEYLAAGYSVDVGTSWHGAQSTRADGYCRWGSPSIGGHSYQLLWYDLDKNQIGFSNSWDNAQFGLQPGGLWWTDLNVYMQEFSAQTMRSGQSEAVVIAEVGIEVKPKRWDWSQSF